MKFVEPTVFLLGETSQDHQEVKTYLEYISRIYETDATVCLEHIKGSDSEQLVELAARRCYLSYAPGLNPNITKVRTDSEDYHTNILNQKHGSVEEHGSATWAFEGVSRVFTHELVRHRAGTAFSQESLRYVRLGSLRFWFPPETDDPEILRVCQDYVERAEQFQLQLAKMFDIDNLTDFNRKKQITSFIRRFAPDGLATGIWFTCNIRALRHIIEMRTSLGAEVEIRIVFNKVAEIAVSRWPMVFSDFTKYIDVTDRYKIPVWKPVNSKI